MKAVCCIASRHLCSDQKVVLEHTAKTTSNGKLAHMFCALMMNDQMKWSGKPDHLFVCDILMKSFAFANFRLSSLELICLRWTANQSDFSHRWPPSPIQHAESAEKPQKRAEYCQQSGHTLEGPQTLTDSRKLAGEQLSCRSVKLSVS